MKSIFINNVNFRGQFAENVEGLLRGEAIGIGNFYNGGWEPTSKVKRFAELVEKAEIPVIIEGESLRNRMFKLK